MDVVFQRLGSAPGITLIPLTIAAFDDLDARFGNTIVLCEAFEVWTRFCRNKKNLNLADFAAKIASPDVQAVFLALPAIASAEACARAIAHDLPRLRAAYAQLFADHALALIAMPTHSVQPPLIGEDEVMQTDLGPRSTFDTVSAKHRAGHPDWYAVSCYSRRDGPGQAAGFADDRRPARTGSLAFGLGYPDRGSFGTLKVQTLLPYAAFCPKFIKFHRIIGDADTGHDRGGNRRFCGDYPRTGPPCHRYWPP